MLTLVLLLRCVKRTSDDLDIYVGTTRAFEWYWNAGDEMLGRVRSRSSTRTIKTRFWPPSNTGATSNAASTSPSLGSTKSTMIQRFSRSRPASIALPSFTPALTSGSYATITRNKNRNWTRSEKAVRGSTNDRGQLDDYVRRTCNDGEYYERN